MVSLLDIHNVLEKSFRVIFPNLKKVYVERIKKLNTPAISIELISYLTPIKDAWTQEKKIDLDIIYFSDQNTVTEAIVAGEKLSALLSLGLKVKDRFIKVSGEPEIKLVDQDLHFLITFSFMDNYIPLVLIEDNKIGEYDPGDTDIGNITDGNEIEEKEPEEGGEKPEVPTYENKLVYLEHLHTDFEI